ncbi:unnamed protein product [Trypanosoma congolense IL3000]|uniref:WGS project CAEQ00000000 data, annotated contig 1393 n=1 Tax=Trypanosoma congolense (strain IL3000) TaxID=1068625 RepID=F9W5W8_TRYCI|nr:unnamed protein product [Trypanosoma congolense IL3000]
MTPSTLSYLSFFPNPSLLPQPEGISMSNSPSSPSPEGMAQQDNPWSMEKDVVEVLLKNIGDPKKINLYRFLQPAYPFMHSYVSRFSITDFARNPWRCVGEADGREQVWEQVPRLLWQFRVLALKLTYMQGPRRVGGRGNGRCGGSFSSWMRRTMISWRGWYGQSVKCRHNHVGSWKRRTRLDTRGPFRCRIHRSRGSPYRELFLLICLYPTIFFFV